MLHVPEDPGEGVEVRCEVRAGPVGVAAAIVCLLNGHASKHDVFLMCGIVVAQVAVGIEPSSVGEDTECSETGFVCLLVAMKIDVQ